MPSPRAQSIFPVSLFATPSPAHQAIFYTVPRAGHLIGGADHHIQRDHFPGHELLLCLKGKGFVRMEGRQHSAGPGDFVWIDCGRPHEHGAVRADPWEVLWVRVEGPRLEQMSQLLGTAALPVFAGFDRRAGAALYAELFALIAENKPEAPALVHAAVARLLALAFCARQAVAGPETRTVPPALARPVERMRLFYFESFRVPELAALAGMSPTHFARQFKAAFGTSPIDWLRRERISQAKRRLAESEAAIKEIAEQVGYRDRYFFSKDFKQHTGLTPGEFRRRERHWR